MDDNNGFSVRDRRGAPDGDQGREIGENAAAGQDGGQMPEMDFSSFVIFLATTAQMNLGSIPHPETGKTEVSTIAAKQMIEILGMLQDKTKGNRTEEEDTLLEQVLFNLRMHYLRVVDEQKKSGGK